MPHENVHFSPHGGNIRVLSVPDYVWNAELSMWLTLAEGEAIEHILPDEALIFGANKFNDEDELWEHIAINPQQPIRVRLVAATNVGVLTGGLGFDQVIDGVVIQPYDLILLAGETDKMNNGLWYACQDFAGYTADQNAYVTAARYGQPKRAADVAGSYLDYAYGLNCVVLEGERFHETSWTAWWGTEGDRGAGAIGTKDIIVRQTYSRLAFLPSRDITTPDYTLVLTDDGAFIRYNYATDTTLTIPPDIFEISSYVNLIQVGAGKITLTPGAGVTLQGRVGLKTAGQWAMATLYQITNNVWVCGGDLMP